MNKSISALLRYGTWSASILTGVGYLLRSSTTSVMMAGIALFILLPIMRVFLMLAVFIRRRDYRYGFIATLVLTIIGLSLVLGARG